MIHSINIREFRLFKDVDIKLGKYITAISGKNTLGKTTLLALLGNSCETKISEGKPILQKQFRTEFSEIFKASHKFDVSGSNKCTVNFSNLENPNIITDSRRCRTTWQKINKNSDNKRFRLIPEAFNGNIKISSAKFHWPVLYLGLSRLFPIGESSIGDASVKNVKLFNDEKDYFINSYLDILSIDDVHEISIDSIDIDETDRKKGVGISTSNYDSLTNSAGQDNVGQILLAVLSFKRLKEKNPDSYKGGLLLIDELDATLHPIAQIKLLNFLKTACQKFALQVVFTTHSVTLLENMCSKTFYNKEDNINNIEVAYITKDNGPLEILHNPSYNIIYNDLNVPLIQSSIKKINVYSEDSECRWFFKKLVDKYLIHLNFANITLGCKELLKLIKADPIYFSNIMFVLDGDVADKEIYINNKYANIIKIPGKVRPEQVIYEFLLQLSSSSDLWSIGREIGFTKENIREHGPLSNDYKGKDRNRYKKWFNDNLEVFESLSVFDYWKENNLIEYEKFLDEFIYKHNEIATRKFYPRIKK